MISRIWHGWTTPANADAYEALLREEIFAGIEWSGGVVPYARPSQNPSR